MAGNDRVANVGYVSLSKSKKSLTIRVLGQLFFVPLRDLEPVLRGNRNMTAVKQWIKQGEEEWVDEEW